MSQRVIYNILKNDLGGSGTAAQIKKIVAERHPEVSLLTVSDKISRLRKWGCVGYLGKNRWYISGEYE